MYCIAVACPLQYQPLSNLRRFQNMQQTHLDIRRDVQMVAQLQRLPTVEHHQLKLLLYRQTIDLAVWNRANGSAILGFAGIG